APLGFLATESVSLHQPLDLLLWHAHDQPNLVAGPIEPALDELHRVHGDDWRLARPDELLNTRDDRRMRQAIQVSQRRGIREDDRAERAAIDPTVGRRDTLTEPLDDGSYKRRAGRDERV